MKEKTVHRAKYINENGDVSALCYKKIRPINLTQCTWTNRNEAVTCKKCKDLINALEAREITQDHQ